MRAYFRGVLLAACAACAAAQFGNANVQWDSAANPTVNAGEPTLHSFKAPEDGRRTSLASLSRSSLSDILTGLNAECPACETDGHYISRIRSTCFALGPKALKAQLTKRGVKCEGCSMREHYLDKVLDTVHLAPKN